MVASTGSMGCGVASKEKTLNPHLKGGIEGS